jgi:hypothetical protein
MIRQRLLNVGPPAWATCLQLWPLKASPDLRTLAVFFVSCQPAPNVICVRVAAACNAVPFASESFFRDTAGKHRMNGSLKRSSSPEYSAFLPQAGPSALARAWANLSSQERDSDFLCVRRF